ncbi:Ig-like domain-containing domain [Dysgonomonas sp. 520]|uniref:Ig-like domain-containing domain n=1 Tax=Dysgonomonas sp. 520 TaxID=2302931 RepID=UPI0013D30EC4|nr:Ig-like domain-containing domain [Dysgonomonas sp. 520]NDW08403.1 hypothetical protein [Dysgonomonas sp. 520]
MTSPISNPNLKTLFFFAVFCIITACASIGTPSGGEYDLDPPKVMKSTPGFNEINVKTNKIEIVFDELVQLEKPEEKVIITPPQKTLPVIQAISKKVTVELKDTLVANTTYTIDFTDAIMDYNEKNALENFSLSFSTGNQIDSLIISGKVLSADNLEPMPGVYVGLHSNLADSAFVTEPFLRISRTNENGLFSIKGIAEGEYRLYALNDINRDYKYDDPAEAIAFFDTTIKPSTTEATRVDSIFLEDGLTLDTVITSQYTRFLPDDIILRSFTSDFKRQYLLKHERPNDNALKVYFGSPTQMPKLEPLNFTPSSAEWALLEKTVENDSLTYWIVDKSIASIDTLTFEMTYLKTDSLNRAVEVTDTCNFINRNRKPEKKDDKKKDKDEPVNFLKVVTNATQSLEVYDKLYFEFEEPLLDFSKDKLKLQILVDTLYTDMPYEIETDSLNPRKYILDFKIEPGKQYAIQADSAIFNSYYGRWTDKIDSKFSVRKLDEYGSLQLFLSGLEKGQHAFVEILDSSDKPFWKETVINDKVMFSNLKPGKYYARIVLDSNNNGVWDTGDYDELKQPEMVYYFDKYVEIRANWESEEDWDITAISLDKQKPLDITKNKPVKKETKREQLEKQDEKNNKKRKRDEEQQRQQENRSRGGSY